MVTSARQPLLRRVSKSGSPAHVQIEDRLAGAIAGGDLHSGDRLPPERELSERFGVSRMTLRQSLASLERRGLVIRMRGRTGGTFVAQPKFEMHVNRLAGLTQQLGSQGRRATTRVLRARESWAGDRAAAALGIASGTFVIEVVRLRLSNEEPFAVEWSAFPAGLLPGLLKEPMDGSLYELLETKYGLAPVRTVERLESVVAADREAAILGTVDGAPLLLVERTAYADGDVAVEYARDLFRGDRTSILIESGRRR
jgi:GntR family transcriptional regulator